MSRVLAYTGAACIVAALGWGLGPAVGLFALGAALVTAAVFEQEEF